MNRVPIAVLISDVHYNINTMYLATAAMNQAIDTSNSLNKPLIVCGDLHDSKANLRAECINELRKTLKKAIPMPYVLIGNHCRINEKSQEHSLSCIEDLAKIINAPKVIRLEAKKLLLLLPYFSNKEELKTYINNETDMIIMHQGCAGTNQGEYIVDHSAINKDDLTGLRVVSGHYHTRQDIELPQSGLLSYVGNPYTLTFGEAFDPPKGYQILYSDRSLEFIPTNLRKHIIFDINDINKTTKFSSKIEDINPQDLLKVRYTVSIENSNKITKNFIKETYKIPYNFQLEITPVSNKINKKSYSTSNTSDIIDEIIADKYKDNDEVKKTLTDLWRKFI